MTLTKQQIYSLIFLGVLILVLPLIMILAQKKQDIRPRAMQGQANLLLSADKNTSTVGETINVLVSMQVVAPKSMTVSGVDFMILYDKDKLDVVNILPNAKTVKNTNPFTDVPIVTSGGIFDGTYNFLRVTELSKTSLYNLAVGGTFTIANITFRSLGEGTAVVKFADDNKFIEIVSGGEYVTPTPCPANACPPTPTGPRPPGPEGLVGWWKME